MDERRTSAFYGRSTYFSRSSIWPNYVLPIRYDTPYVSIGLKYYLPFPHSSNMWCHKIEHFTTYQVNKYPTLWPPNYYCPHNPTKIILRWLIIDSIIYTKQELSLDPTKAEKEKNHDFKLILWYIDHYIRCDTALMTPPNYPWTNFKRINIIYNIDYLPQNR